MKYRVAQYEEKYQQAVTELILLIQQIEFNVPITIEDQPDLQNVNSFYVKGNGNFWLAFHQDKVVGTIALIDIGNDQVTLRKMFVDAGHRGKESGVAQLLFDALIDWCVKQQVKEIFLGTIDTMRAAHRFYSKNGFTQIPKASLPINFPIMRVDTIFFKREVDQTIYHITPLTRWNKFSTSDGYESDSLSDEGFIHCSTRKQVKPVLERYYANETGLVLLHVNPALLTSELKYEVATHGEFYPHVFGKINKEAIFKVEQLR